MRLSRPLFKVQVAVNPRRLHPAAAVMRPFSLEVSLALICFTFPEDIMIRLVSHSYSIFMDMAVRPYNSNTVQVCPSLPIPPMFSLSTLNLHQDPTASPHVTLAPHAIP